jgi:hypothetical protein
VVRIDFNEISSPMVKFITIICIFALSRNHRLENTPNGFKINVFEWNVEGGDLYGSTKGFLTRGRKNILCANSRIFCTHSSNC